MITRLCVVPAESPEDQTLQGCLLPALGRSRPLEASSAWCAADCGSPSALVEARSHRPAPASIAAPGIPRRAAPRWLVSTQAPRITALIIANGCFQDGTR